MARDWWWPWWISTAIDLAIALAALVVLVRARRRRVRTFAAVVVCGALVAAILAPVVMTHPDDKPSMFKK
jgi:predicted exporter